MERLGKILVLVLCGLVIVTPVASQQVHIADDATIAEALNDRLNADAEDREAIVQLLQRPEVRKIASDVHIDIVRVEAAVSTLSGAELQELAANARAVDETLSGAGTITISTTTIIIGLLVLILIIVAV